MVLKPMNRRTFLRAAGVAIGLPYLDAMAPAQEARMASPRRMVLVGRPLGMHGAYFFPERAGRDYEAPRYLRGMESVRGNFTVFSGISHRGYSPGHHTEVALMTG